jgi:hypothetical protein
VSETHALVRTALGASADVSVDVIRLYIPDRDKHGMRIRDHRAWCERALALLARFHGGATATPAYEGIWRNPDTNEEIRENTVIIYCYVDPAQFQESLSYLRELLHSFGHDTNQGEVVVEFQDRLYRIREFKPKLP